MEAAVSIGERLVRSEPMSAEAQDLLGRAYGRKAEHAGPLAQISLARKARARFARAVELDPEDAAALDDLATYDRRAPAFLGGDRGRAHREAERLLGLDPMRGHRVLGDLAEDERDLRGAEAQYRLAVEAGPGSPDGRRALSAFLVRRKRFAEARTLWASSPGRGAPEPLAAYERAGIALSDGEGLKESLSELRDLLAAGVAGDDPRRAEVCARLALVASRLGLRDEAREHLTEALRLEPRQRDWQKELARLTR